MKRILKTLLASLMLSFSLLSILQPATIFALDSKAPACEALGAVSGTTGDCTAPSGPNVSNTLKLGINAFSLIIGFAAVVMIIVGGFKYIISQGESSNTAGAKNTILYAIVGLVVVALAQVIVKFVLAKASK